MRAQESNRIQVARESVRDSIQAHIDWLDQEIKTLTRTIRQHIDHDPEMKNKRDLLDPFLASASPPSPFCGPSASTPSALATLRRLCRTRSSPP
jgi:hypothetical protein